MYRVKDLEKLIDRDRNTILRWEREGKISPAQKDSRGWRFYSDEDVKKIIEYISKANPYYNVQSVALGKNISFEKKSER